jgi:D-glycero-D-manno-heptose 1,7-bisphosphate phosphatase
VVKEVVAHGYSAVVVTNQRCVARGIVSLDTIDIIHSHLRMVLKEEHDIDLLDLIFCPHDRDDGCECRKPKPGMLLTVAQRHGIDVASSWMIGDHETDIEAGRAAGCRTIRVLYDESETGADFSVKNMVELQTRIPEILESIKKEED